MVLLFSIESFRWWSLSWWSSRQKSPSSRRANSSPGTNCFSHATHRKHSKWKILFLARITKSFLPKDLKHLSHFVPNSLQMLMPSKIGWTNTSSRLDLVLEQNYYVYHDRFRSFERIYVSFFTEIIHVCIFTLHSPFYSKFFHLWQSRYNFHQGTFDIHNT